MSGILDVEDPLRGQYSLEVSSPGLERPLFQPAHFARFIDSKVRIKLQQKLDGRKHLVGTITAVDGDEIVIHDTDDDIERRITMTEIDKAQLVPEWD